MVREAFKTLLKEWGRSYDLVFAPEYELITPAKERRLVDGALLHELRLPFGYWEAKDEKDDLDAEIEIKFRRGYPQDNIIFEDSRHAVLIQDRQEVIRCAVDDPEQLEKLLKLFFAYERAEIAEFRQAVAQFKTDLPAVLEALREMIQKGTIATPPSRPGPSISATCPGNDKSQCDGCRCAGNVNPAHPHGRYFLQGFRRRCFSPSEQCGEETL